MTVARRTVNSDPRRYPAPGVAYTPGRGIGIAIFGARSVDLAASLAEIHMPRICLASIRNKKDLADMR